MNSEDFTIHQLFDETAQDADNGLWVPKLEDSYYYVTERGWVFGEYWLGDPKDLRRFKFGNCFPTKELAESHARRVRSMKPPCPVPKDGDEVWVILSDNSYNNILTWSDKCLPLYYQGRIHLTKESCFKWVAKYGDAWTVMP